MQIVHDVSELRSVPHAKCGMAANASGATATFWSLCAGAEAVSGGSTWRRLHTIAKARTENTAAVPNKDSVRKRPEPEPELAPSVALLIKG